jgi:D-3-phosphoglycerate dehydrogenase
MAKYKVYVSDYDYPDLSIEKEILEPIGAEVIGLQCKSGKGLAELAHDADVILQQYAEIPRETLAKLKKCKGICRYGIGVDIVDVEAAYEYGMVVANVPDYCIDEVGDHTLALGLMLLRRIPMYHNAVRAGRWHWKEAGAPIFRFRNTTWGLIGFGRIAQNVARKLQGLSISVIACDPNVSGSYMGSTGVKKADFDTVLSEADVVAVMTPYMKETHHLIDERALKMMKPHGVLLNCARGKIVDNKALYRALTEGWIAAAGLDDTEEEPAKQQNWHPNDNPLFSLDNCIITPHVAYISETSIKESRETVAENAKAILLGQVPPYLVYPKRK